jgi:hypothetical protein
LQTITAIQQKNHEWIRKASARGLFRIVELLLTRETDPSAKDNYAIRLASANGHVEVVKELLLDSRVDPSTHNNYAIKSAVISGRLDIVELLKNNQRINWEQLRPEWKNNS